MKKILICDDDQDILEVCSIILSGLGMEIHTRSSVEDIEAILNEIEPDLVFMDNKIPENGGPFYIKTMKNSDKYSSLPVYLFSANPQIEEIAKESGADGYLKKPFDIKTIEQLVRSHLG